MTGRPGVLSLLTVLSLALPAMTACGDEAKEPETDRAATITVTSPAFAEGEVVPRRFTCDGGDTSPPLSWAGVPDAAAALALVVDDPDAPSGTFTHWVVLDISADVTSVAAGSRPRSGVEVANSSGRTAYVGPCPPSGTHRYRFTVYALSADTGIGPDASLDEALSAVEDALAWGRLTGTYTR
jgi:Raf kinase inhibitor-like YbhB/YbcL family protein